MKKRILVLVLGLAVSNAGFAEGAGGVVVAAGQIKSASHELLVRSIREKQVLRFVYNGHARVVEPHAYGVAATGEVVLHAFQVEGESASRPPPGWRTFNVALIEALAATEGRFSDSRPGYVPGEPALATVWAAVGAP